MHDGLDPAAHGLSVFIKEVSKGTMLRSQQGFLEESSWSSWATPSRHMPWLPALAASALPCNGLIAVCACMRL